MNIKTLLFATGLCFCSIVASAQSGNNLFNPAILHEVRLYFYDENFWDTLVHNYEENIDDSGVGVPLVKAYAKIDGNWLDTLGVRQKGLSSHYSSSEKKKPFKIDLNQFVADQTFDGIKKFNLQNGACDPAMMRDFVGYNILRTAGVKAPRVSYCRLYLNDEYWGLYEIIEQIDATFIDNNFSDNDGTLIKNIGWSELHWEGDSIQPYLADFQLKTNEDEYDWASFLHFLDMLNNAPDSVFAEEINKIFDVDGYLHVMAVDVMTNNWDSYLDNRRNWYLYENPDDGKFHWIPWDYNLSLGGDFPSNGNPYPPFDTDCFLQSTFSYSKIGNEIFFSDESFPYADTWQWDFGDGSTSVEANPMHAFSTQSGEVKVCLTTTRNYNGQICESTRCKEIYLNFNVANCNTFQNGTCPYPPSDPIAQQVMEADSYCCSDSWDAFCQLHYQEIVAGGGNPLNEGVDYDLNLPLIVSDPDKVLVRRLMDVPEFKTRYFDICCVLLENNFNQARLFPLIDAQVDLIREAIYEDPNYVFTTDYFEYDAGNGTGGGGDASIPALKWVLAQRFGQLEEQLAAVNHDCGGAFSPIGWHEVVINEFMAVNDSTSSITDDAGEHEDWIELYNNSTEVVNLSSFYLTDDAATPRQWKFPQGTLINPKSYLIVWADKDETQQGLHCNFKLSGDGEYLALLQEDGTKVDSFSFGEQAANVASARIPNGTGDFVQQAPTFYQFNGDVSSTDGKQDFGKINIYPNPGDNLVHILLPGLPHSEKFITLYFRNPYGQIVLSEVVSASNEITVNTSQLPQGCYFLEMQMGNVTHIEKFIVVR